MSWYWAVAALVLFLMIVLVWYVANQTTEHLDTSGFASKVPGVMKMYSHKKPVKSFMDMTDGEKVDFIIDTYFKAETDVKNNDAKKKAEDNYINSLPVANTGSPLPGGGTCGNDFDDCQLWAQNGECNINPEFMLYSCPGACGACALTPQQKHNVTVIYNNRAPAGIVSHGQNYPGNFPYLNRMYSYNVHYT